MNISKKCIGEGEQYSSTQLVAVDLSHSLKNELINDKNINYTNQLERPELQSAFMAMHRTQKEGIALQENFYLEKECFLDEISKPLVYCNTHSMIRPQAREGSDETDAQRLRIKRIQTGLDHAYVIVRQIKVLEAAFL